MMFRRYLIFFIIIASNSYGREGMWLPHLLKELNETEMKSMGMEIGADEIFSINNSSLKDAVLQFGGGCTGELISEKGLLITNHHCGFSQIQSLSTVSRNYLADGFWAKSNEEEIPCPGLTVTFIREIVDVSEPMLKDLIDSLNEESRNAILKSRSDSIEKSITGGLKGLVRAFYQGNKYYLFKTEVFSDIRFVGAPPQSIGKFGGETDNWMWPRHTGDFSLFRIYSNKENKPAAYSKDNVPYSPNKFLTINIGGVEENDFVFIFGFPGRTQRYLPSAGLELIEEQTNPNRIKIREVRLDAMRAAMSKNDTVKLQYASKFATLENAYKKWQGELVGFSRFDAISQKETEEAKFMKRLAGSNHRSDTSLLTQYARLNEKAKPLNFANDFFVEGFPGIELVSATSRFKKIVELSLDDKQEQKIIDEELIKIRKDFRNFYKNHNRPLDKQICAELLSLAAERLNKSYLPASVKVEENKPDRFQKFTDDLYKESIVADSTKLMKFLDEYKRNDAKKILKDPVYKLSAELTEIQSKVQAELGRLNSEMARIQRRYMSEMLALSDTKLFPDANGTLRVSYGKIEGTEARDGMRYTFYTTADGILAKSETGESDYIIPDALAQLIRNNDYGRYGNSGKLPVAFLASAHTTGGNSGSPALNAKGELVGVNYDRIWEGVLSDYYYDEKYCRNICLDIRYALFIIEKYGKAMRLIEEMKIVN